MKFDAGAYGGGIIWLKLLKLVGIAMKTIFDRAVTLIAGLSLLLNGIALADFLLHPLAGDYNFNSPIYRAVTALVLIPLTLLVGFLIIRRVPGNVVGRLLIVWCGTVAYNSLRGTIDPIPLALYYAYDVVFGWLALILMMVHFPDGRIRPPRLAPWVYRLLPLHILLVVLTMLTTKTLQIPSQLSNPFFVPALEPLTGVVLGGGLLLMVGLMVLSIVLPVLRYRRGSPLERLQIKWLALFTGVNTAYAIVVLVIYPLFVGGEVMEPGNGPGGLVFYLLSGLLPPVTIGIAVLRYRLWDINIIIRRTLIYSTLTLVLSGIYFGSVVLLQSTFTVLTGQQSPAALVISTLGIAALFTPLRRRIQSGIDHRFYRRKIDAEQVLAEYRIKLRNEVDQDRLVQSTLGVVEECLHPAHLSLWLKPVVRRTQDER